MLLLRGFSKVPDFPSFAQTYKLNPAAIAAYPMYRGLAQVVGMEVVGTGNTFGDEIKTLQDSYSDHDFFYIHYKVAGTIRQNCRIGGRDAHPCSEWTQFKFSRKKRS